MIFYTKNSDDDSNGTPMGSDDECKDPKPCCRGCKKRGECEKDEEEE